MKQNKIKLKANIDYRRMNELSLKYVNLHEMYNYSISIFNICTDIIVKQKIKITKKIGQNLEKEIFGIKQMLYTNWMNKVAKSK